MKRIILALLAGFLLVHPVFAQKKTFTIIEAAGLNPKLYPTGLQQLNWLPETTAFVYKINDAIVSGRPGSENRDTLIRLSEVTDAMKAAGYKEVTALPYFNWITFNDGWFRHENTYYTYNLTTKAINRLCELPEQADFVDINPQTGYLAYCVDNNLFIGNAENHIQVTSDPEFVVNGQSVHRNEFGISKGTFWSPDGNKLAYYRMDESMVTQYPIVDMGQRVAALKNIRYPMAGMTSHQVSVVVYDLEQKTSVTLQTGLPADQYLTSLSWSPDSRSIFLAILNREQNHLKMNRYDVTGGSLMTTLFEEKDEQYVEPLNPLYFVPGKPNHFIWNSQRDGFNHLYLYQTDGRLIRQLTSGPWVVTDFEGFDISGKFAFFMSTEESPLERHAYRLELNTGKRTKLTRQKGTHRIDMNDSGDYFLDHFSSLEVSREIRCVGTKNKVSDVLHQSPDPLLDYLTGEISLFQIPATDGTPLYCRLIKPAGFDAQKKYPVLVYVYGGPHAQLVNNTWMGGASFYLQYMAQQGFVVFTLDNRGSANRGEAFEQVIHRRLGDVETEDQMAGINYLKKLDFVDTSRIGVDGWSYGGFMSLTLKLRHPEVFRVAVAGGPVTDWKYYEVMYGERYMDTPEENPEGYSKASIMNQIEHLEGKVLVIHGDNDPVVVMQHSMDLLQKSIELGKQIEFFVYPGHEHNIRGRHRAHLVDKISTFFIEHLKIGN